MGVDFKITYGAVIDDSSIIMMMECGKKKGAKKQHSQKERNKLFSLITLSEHKPS